MSPQPLELSSSQTLGFYNFFLPPPPMLGKVQTRRDFLRQTNKAVWPIILATHLENNIPDGSDWPSYVYVYLKPFLENSKRNNFFVSKPIKFILWSKYFSPKKLCTPPRKK